MTRQYYTSFLLALFVCAIAYPTVAAEWKPAKAPLMTRWASEVSPDNALPEYPRPQLVRDNWTNLNGLWNYAIVGVDADLPEAWAGEILVPFPIESALSGVGKTVGPYKTLWYQRSFEAPVIPEQGRLLLHFGAVDWHAQVWVNGTYVGEHRGGFDPFSFDIMDALTSDGQQQIVVRVWDPSDAGSQPRGKQVQEPGGIFYTSVTGIWQTVWLEAVPNSHIRSLKITPSVDESTFEIAVNASGGKSYQIELLDDGKVISKATGQLGKPITIRIADVKLWSTAAPHLYDLVVRLDDTDEVRSYFGMRKLDFRQDESGVNRMFLNNEPLFQYGPLDQGWWPDGLYTAPTDEALRYDIEITKKMGFNMARKHVKVEPARWYYWADKIGLLVWQDMPSLMAKGQPQQVHGGQPEDVALTAQEEMQYHVELKAMIDGLRNHTSVVVWVPFNEGWGQHKTNAVLKWTKTYDPTRLVGGPSGWEDRGTGDLKDMHSYPGPGMFPALDDRVSVLGEFGGLGLPIEGHLWQSDKNWGYRTYKTPEELADHYHQLMIKLHPLVSQGLAAAVYTQTTDVEGEVNGLLTYDREVVKIETETLAKWHARLYQAPPVVKTLVPIARQATQTWRYTTAKPGDDWSSADFDDAKWSAGESGFGTDITPGTTVRTQWNTEDIWLRRTFTLDEIHNTTEVMLNIFHDEDAQVFINGISAAKITRYSSDYVFVPVSEKAAQSLRRGENAISIHCHQTRGGQFIDAGLIQLVPAKTD